MLVAVIDDQMTFTRYSTYQIRSGANRFTANTECRADILFLQNVQQPRSNIWLRTIIEAQEDFAPAEPNVLNLLPNGPLRSPLLRKFHSSLYARRG